MAHTFDVITCCQHGKCSSFACKARAVAYNLEWCTMKIWMKLNKSRNRRYISMKGTLFWRVLSSSRNTNILNQAVKRTLALFVTSRRVLTVGQGGLHGPVSSSSSSGRFTLAAWRQAVTTLLMLELVPAQTGKTAIFLAGSYQRCPEEHYLCLLLS